jgi:leucyl-tRNA---protein transferase
MIHYYSESVPVETMTPGLLDTLLALGWYRMSDKFFTTSFIRFGHEIYNTVWLRIKSEGFTLSPSLKKLKKLNRHFCLTYQPLILDDEMEVVFASYKTIARFETAANLTEHLYSKSVFHKMSHCVKIYDGDLLIGCGVYEQGIESLEGLISFYHSDYQKYSLGKYLILTKIEHGIDLGCSYYYLGYYVPGYPKFDYKLLFSKENTEYFDPTTKTWHKLNHYTDYYDEITIMRDTLMAKSQQLIEKDLPHRLAKNPFFDMNIYFDYGEYEPLMLPWYIILGDEEDINVAHSVHVLFFDTRDHKYTIAHCHLFGFVPAYLPYDQDFFDNKVLVVTEIVDAQN